MIHLTPYNEYQKQDEMNEGLKSWVSAFLILANLGLAPLSVISGSRQQKEDFVRTTIQTNPVKYEAAMLVDHLNKTRSKLTPQVWEQFKQENGFQSEYSDIQGLVTRNGKVYVFNNTIVQKDWSGVDIHKFVPVNWLTDMADMIPDVDEHKINNMIAEYEERTEIEIGIVTVEDLEGESIDLYTNDLFQRIGVGKKATNNGVLLVVSEQDRLWRIETGYGIEYILTDADCSRIGREMTEYFKKGNYEEGIIHAVRSIEETIGEEDIVLRNQQLEEEHERQQEALREGFMKVLEVILGIIVVSLLSWGAVHLIRRAKASREEKRERARKILELLKIIKELRSNFPRSSEVNFSPGLNRLYEIAKGTMKGTEYLTDERSLEELSNIFHNMNSAIRDYRNFKSNIDEFKSEFPDISKYLQSASEKIDMINNVNKEIEEYGYTIEELDEKGILDKVAKKIERINSLYTTTDIDKAMNELRSLKAFVGSISSRLSGTRSSLSNIKSAESDVKNWKSIINGVRREFDKWANKKEKEEADERIEKLGKTLSKGSTDYLAMAALIAGVVSFMNRIIADYKRRKREEEEEESYSSGSGYGGGFGSSSGGGFGGFGGGMSGGGGASGGW